MVFACETGLIPTSMGETLSMSKQITSLWKPSARKAYHLLPGVSSGCCCAFSDTTTSTQAEVPQEIRPYSSFNEEVTVQNGLLFKGDSIIVPARLRKEMMQEVHSSRLGIEGCSGRAREVLYRPRMNAELKDFTLKCDVCNSYKPWSRLEKR